jgi:hypothetical protein
MDQTLKLFWRRGSAARSQLKGVCPGGLGLRLPIVVLAALGGLGLFCDDAQAGRWLPTIENPYCPITTYMLRDVPEQAVSTKDPRGRPVIVVSRRTFRDRPSYGKFLMAHECCHHTLGHVGKFRKGLGGQGPQPFFYIAPELKRMELEADCCAIKLLRDRQEADGIEAARSSMVTFGKDPTGAYHPTGYERAANILLCAAPDQPDE